MPTQRPWPEASAPSRPATSRASKRATPSAGSRAPTTTSTSESIEVALETDDHAIACEITIETPGAKELGNIQKAIDAGFDKIIVICPNPRKRKGLAAAIETQFGSGQVPIVCIPPSELEDHIERLRSFQRPSARFDGENERSGERTRGFRVAREFADRADNPNRLSESNALHRIAELMRPVPASGD